MLIHQSRTPEKRAHAEMRQCLVWNLHHTQGLTYKKIAAALGISHSKAWQLSREYERRCEIKQKFFNADYGIHCRTINEWSPKLRSMADVLNESINSC